MALSDVLKYHIMSCYCDRMSEVLYNVRVTFNVRNIGYAIAVVVSIKLLCLEAFHFVGWSVGRLLWSGVRAIQLDPV